MITYFEIEDKNEIIQKIKNICSSCTSKLIRDNNIKIIEDIIQKFHKIEDIIDEMIELIKVYSDLEHDKQFDFVENLENHYNINDLETLFYLSFIFHDLHYDIDVFLYDEEYILSEYRYYDNVVNCFVSNMKLPEENIFTETKFIIDELENIWVDETDDDGYAIPYPSKNFKLTYDILTTLYYDSIKNI